jgi:hypothetical protein
MTTTIVKTIGTGGDYATPQAWNNAAPADLTAVDQIWQGQLLNQAFSGSGVQLVISGSVSSATCYKELITAPGASWRDQSGVRTSPFAFNVTAGASITSTSTAGQAAVQVNEANARIGKFQIRNTDLGATSPALEVLNSSTTIQIDSVITESYNTVAASLYRAKASNCLFISRAGNVLVTVDAGCEIHSSTIVRPSDKTVSPYGINANNQSGLIFKNTVVLGATATYVNMGGATATSCATSASSPPTGFTTVPYTTATVTNLVSTTLDMRLPVGSALIDAGTTDATISLDASGVSRPQGTNPDIGAWEYSTPASILSGTVVSDDTLPAGTISSSSSGLTGNVTLDATSPAGVLGLAPGVLTSQPLRNNFGTLLANVTGVIVNVYGASNGAYVTRQTGLTSNSSGVVIMADAALTPGISYAYEVDLSVASLGRRLPVGVAA